jgi:hypothetical protein
VTRNIKLLGHNGGAHPGSDGALRVERMQICSTRIVGMIFIPNAVPKSNRVALRQPAHFASSSDTFVLC